MIVILMGAPGAGKGTQAEYLKDKKRFLKISTGDLLRREIALKTELGKRVENIVHQGSYVSDEILMGMIKNELDNSVDRDIVLDGFPRTVSQAKWLHGIAKVDGVIHIETDREELIGRVTGRVVCSRCNAVFHLLRKPPQVEGVCDVCGEALKTREDDTRERVLHRLDVYATQTAPVLEFYKEAGQYYSVDGNCNEIAVNEQIDASLVKMKQIEGAGRACG
jgi:adenylate kinase